MATTRNREAVTQAAMIDRIAAQFEARIVDAIVAETEQAVNAWLVSGVIPQIDSRPFDAVYQSMGIASAVAMATRFDSQAKAHQLTLEVKSFADIMAQFALSFIRGELIRRRIVRVAETTRRDIVDAVQAGQEAGRGQEVIARDIIANAPVIAKRRARVIARTEVHAAANAGALEAAKKSGLPMKKTWVSVQDHRTRDFLDATNGTIAQFDHRTINGQTVGMDQPFLVPAINGAVEPLQYPGDPAGSPANCINCRCAMTFELDIERML